MTNRQTSCHRPTRIEAHCTELKHIVYAPVHTSATPVRTLRKTVAGGDYILAVNIDRGLVVRAAER